MHGGYKGLSRKIKAETLIIKFIAREKRYRKNQSAAYISTNGILETVHVTYIVFLLKLPKIHQNNGDIIPRGLSCGKHRLELSFVKLFK